MTAFITLTRVYKVALTGEIKTQPVSINVLEIATVRPSNRLGKAVHRATVTLTNGVEIETAEKYSEVLDVIEGTDVA